MHLVIILGLAGLSLPPPPPPLPPLVLDIAAPVVTVTIDGAPLRLRVDPGAAGHVELNASAARRLDLTNPARRVGGRPVVQGRTRTDVGKVGVPEITSAEVLMYEGRTLLRTLAWTQGDPVTAVDGLINPLLLPHDDVRLVRRAASAGDVVVHVPMHWNDGRGLLGTVVTPVGSIDVAFAPAASETLATAAAASLLAQAFGGQLRGPARQALISHGVTRPVRDLVLARPVDVAGVRFDRVAARVFDWSGGTDIPDADPAADEVVVAGRTDAQRQWPKLAIGNDHLGACAELRWTRVPLAMDLVCPALP